MVPLLGRPLLGWTLAAFADCEAIDGIVLVGADGEIEALRTLGAPFGGGKLHAVVVGGTTRQESVRAGLAALPPSARHVLVHDAARCCITPEAISRVAAALESAEAATLAAPVVDTLTRDDGSPVERDGLWSIQTPQGFHRSVLSQAHQRALQDGYAGTDDASLVRRLGTPVTLIEGAADNVKVTRPEDRALAEALLRARTPEPAMTLRIGYGYDVHALADDRPLFLGGVAFPESPRGLAGHSDADALLHAVCDALLGAAGLPDIGQLFPPSDNRHKNRPSIEFVREVMDRLRADGWGVVNLDCTVLAEAPKIGPRRTQMQETIAEALGVAPECIGIKATTGEGMGFVGRGEGIAAHAVALLQREKPSH